MVEHSMTFGAQTEDIMHRINREQGLSAVAIQFLQKFAGLRWCHISYFSVDANGRLVVYPVVGFFELIWWQIDPRIPARY